MFVTFLINICISLNIYQCQQKYSILFERAVNNSGDKTLENILLLKRTLHCHKIIFLCLQFEADRRAIIITINSFGTELGKDDRAKLYPRCGRLNPDGLAALARADDYEQVKAVAEYYAVSKVFLK